MFDGLDGVASPAEAQPASAGLRPAEVADALGVSPATLRRWSRRFEDYLQARDSSADGSHRRYTGEDLAVLRQVKARLEEGWTYDQVAEQLSAEAANIDSTESILPDDAEMEVAEEAFAPESAQSLIPARPADGQDTSVSPEGWPPAAQILRDALQAVTDNQQLLLNTQHANRDLMGVVIQDNLNLKDENTNLRERMLDLERELAEMRRRHADFRERMETRVRVLEDAVSTLMARQAPSVHSAPGPSAAPPSYPPAEPQPERRSFWSRLLGG